MIALPTIEASSPLQLFEQLTQPQSLLGWGILAACLLVSWALVRLAGSQIAHEPSSVWFGKRGYDGVMFPILALALAFAAKAVFAVGHKGAVLKIAVPVLMSLLVIRLSVRVLSATFPDSRWMRMIERSISWMAWGAVVLWVTGILPVVMESLDEVRWKMGASQISLRNVVEGGLTAALTLMLALWVSAAIERRLLTGGTDNLSVRKMAANLVRTLLLFVGLLVGLSAVGIDLTALSVLGGAIGVGLGFGLQKIAANYVSGFVILAEQSLRIGDVVKVDQFEGRITDIRTRYTVIQALNGREAIVPNEVLMTTRVENSSLADPRVLLNTTVSVEYGTDVPALQKMLSEAVMAVPRVLSDPPVSVHLTEFGADGLVLTVNFWIADPENGTGLVRSEVNLAILGVLNRAGIDIPYPQRVVRQIAAAD